MDVVEHLPLCLQKERRFVQLWLTAKFILSKLRTHSKTSVCSHSTAGNGVSNPTGVYGYLSLVNVVYCVDRGLCDGPIFRPEESYRMCLCVYHLVSSGATITLYTYSDKIKEAGIRNLRTGCNLLEKIFQCTCNVYSCSPVLTHWIFSRMYLIIIKNDHTWNQDSPLLTNLSGIV